MTAAAPARTTCTTPASRVHRAHLKTASPLPVKFPEPGCPRRAHRPGLDPVKRARSGPACVIRISFPELADPVSAHLDRFRVEHAVAARDGFPDACRAQFRGEEHVIVTDMVHLSLSKAGQVLVEHESRAAADGGNRRTKGVQPEGCG